ncbi:hypothetical protein [Deinococcus koreensis]|uniref:Lipoprotein n=1 Tax=Deinococcus koreensis TaxID=2054903 RepID=A0A2K3UYW2_9DEIO|nr:hypothetical protein [Deinococcus koreensis]PNY81729.1 hypothetical protein CVO96_10380 [Deinococcus koreensis]
MKRLIPLSLLGLLSLSACGSSAPGAPDGGRPPLPSGVEVRFPAAPANAYLNLLKEDGTSVYQISVAAGKTVTEVDPTGLNVLVAEARPVSAWLPATVQGTPVVSAPAAKLNFLHWIMWRDKDSDGVRDAGEELPLMTHDRVAYASEAVTLSFQTTTPDMKQTWTLAAGWSRAEHYVYLPRDTTTYLRSLETSALKRYTLHVTTPITSQ